MEKFIRLHILFLLICAKSFAGDGDGKYLAPVAGFTSPSMGCAPYTLTFTSTSTSSPGDPIVKYTWNMDDGTSFTSASPTYTYTYVNGRSTPYEVSLEVETQNGLTAIAYHPTALGIFVAKPNLGPDITMCASELAFNGATLLMEDVPGSFSVTWSDPFSHGYTTKVYAPGTYWVQASTTMGACSLRDTIVITATPSVNINYTYAETANCGGTATYLFTNNSTLNCTGSSLGYSATVLEAPSMGFRDARNSFSYSFTSNGTYHVIIEVIDNTIGSSTYDTIPVTVVLDNPAPPTVPVMTNQTICGNSVTLDAGYEAGVTYSWSPAAGLSNANIYNPVASPTSTQVYTVTKTKCGLTATGSVTVTVNTPFATDLLGPADTVLCNKGFIVWDLATVGATGATSIVWGSNADASFGVRGMPNRLVNGTVPSLSGAGQYWVTVVKDGCTVRDTMTLAMGTGIYVGFNSVQTESCAPYRVQFNSDAHNTRSRCGTITGYRWDFGDGNNVLYSGYPIASLRNPEHIYSAPGTYNAQLTVYNDNGDSEVYTAPVVVTGSSVPVNLGNDIIICTGSTITLDAGNAGASYEWSTGATSQTIDVSTAGTYTVNVTVGGCVGRDTIVISTAASISINLGNDTTICAGSTLILDAGAYPGATYLWSTGETTRTKSVTSSGNYSVQVTTGGCTGNGSINVTVTPAATVDLGPDMSICAGSSLILDAGAFPGATYLWNTGETTQSISVNTSDTYSVEVISGSCTSTGSIEVTVAPGLTVRLGNDTTICDGTTLVLDAGSFPGATYLWSTGETTQTIEVSGTDYYMVDVSSGTCSGTGEIYVEVAPPVYVDLGPDVTICSSDVLTLDAGPLFGGSYLWSTGATTQAIDVNSAGTYSVVASFAGCSHSSSINVTVTPGPVLTLPTDTTICVGSTLVLDAGAFAGADYLWSTGEMTQTIEVTTGGTYWLTVDQNGCYTDAEINVTVSTGLSINLGDDVNLCSGQSVVLDAGFYPGATYTWSNGAATQTITVTDEDDYSVVVDNGVCSGTGSVYVTVATPVNVDLGADTEICSGTTIYLDAGFHTGATYLWNTGHTNRELEVTTAGTYSVSVTVGSCVYTDEITITVVQPHPINLGVDRVICEGTVEILDAGFDTEAAYFWNTGEDGHLITVTEAGFYKVEVLVNGCLSEGSVNISTIPSFTVDLGNDTTICRGGSITLDAGNDGASYLWSTGDAGRTLTLNNLQDSETFTVAVVKDGCMGNGEIHVEVLSGLPVSLGNDTTVCSTPFVLDAGFAGASYIWDDGSTNQTRSITTSGSYSVTVDNNGCVGTDQINVTVTTMPTSINLGNDTTLCFGGALTLDAGVHEGATYAWSTGATSQTISVSTSGTYRVVVSACEQAVEDQIVVVVGNAPVPTITQVGMELVATTGNSYQWYKGGVLIPGATSRTIKPKGYGTYSVTVGATGCAGEASYFFVPNGEIYLGDIRVKVTPNPSYGQPKIIFSKLPSKPVVASVFDRIGRKIMVRQMPNTSNELNLTTFAKGEYLVELVLDDNRIVIPVVIQ